jgi:hypothetical protein
VRVRIFLTWLSGLILTTPDGSLPHNRGMAQTGYAPEGDNLFRVESMFEICHRMKVARCSYPSK